MSVLQYALSHIKFSINRAILEKAFLGVGTHWRQALNTSVDEQILNNVLRARVLIDCNLIGGTQATIPLDGLEQVYSSDHATVIHIPKERTQGRSINSVLNVSFINPLMTSTWAGGAGGMGVQGVYGASESTALMGAMQGVLAAQDKIPMTSTSRVQLISENTILIKDSISMPRNCYLRCVLSLDDNLNSLPLRSYRKFAELSVHAVKAYIYNELLVNMDQGELQGGSALGTFKEIVQSYSEAELNYNDFLTEQFEAILFMSDTETYHRFIKMMVGGGR